MPGFLNKTLATVSQDGRNFILAEPLYYQDDNGDWYAIPAGSKSDGVSTPAVMWPTDPPFGADRWYTGIMHDASPKYRCTLLLWAVDHWTTPQLDLDQCNALLKRALISQGTSPVKAEEYFLALNAFGIQSSVADLSEAIGKITVPPARPA